MTCDFCAEVFSDDREPIVFQNLVFCSQDCLEEFLKQEQEADLDERYLNYDN